MEKCPVCGSKIGEGAEACDVCGTAFDEIPSKCPLCDTEVDELVAECPNCGAEMNESQDSVPDTEIDEVEIAEMPSEADKETAELIATDVFVDVELEELVKLSGVGPLKAQILYDAGFKDLRTLKRASVVELMNIRGIGRKAAGEIKSALRESTLEEIRETEITKETVEAEYQCPLCETIVSAYETSCYECGCIFEPGAVADEDSDRLALSYYDSKLLRSPDNKDLWYARGATLVKIEEYEQALNSFNRALELDKTFQAAWMSKAEVYNKLGDSTKAAECYSHIITSASAGLTLGGEDDDDDDFMDDMELDKPAEEQTASEEETISIEDEEIEPEEIIEEPEEGPVIEQEIETDIEEDEPVEESAEDESEEIVQTDSLEDEEDEKELVLEEPEEIIEEPAEEPVEEEIIEAGVETDDGTSGEMPYEPEEETVIEQEPEDDLELEPPEEEPVIEPEPELIEEPGANGPEVIKPHSYDEISSSGINIDMDYTRPEPERPDLDGMTDTEMKKYLSKRASHVKPYLALARSLDVDINHAKRLIAKAVAESKKGDLKMAIEIINEGIDFAETEFHKKVAEDIDNMATLIRDLKITGIDVSNAVELITETKKMLEDGKIIEAVESLQKCLEHVEKIAS